MEKSSFSLLETVLSLIILSILVSGFSQLTYLKKDTTVSFNFIANLFKTHTTNPHLHSTSLGYQTNASNITFTQGNTLKKTTYNDGIFQLEHYSLKEKKLKALSLKYLNETCYVII